MENLTKAKVLKTLGVSRQAIHQRMCNKNLTYEQAVGIYSFMRGKKKQHLVNLKANNFASLYKKANLVLPQLLSSLDDRCFFVDISYRQKDSFRTYKTIKLLSGVDKYKFNISGISQSLAYLLGLSLIEAEQCTKISITFNCIIKSAQNII